MREALQAFVAPRSSHSRWAVAETRRQQLLPRIRIGALVGTWLMGGDQPLRGEVESIGRGIAERNASTDGQLLADVEPISTGGAWRSGFRCGSGWTRCPRGWR